MGRAKMADNNEFYRLKLVLSLQDRLSKRLAKIDEAVQKYETQLQKAVVITEKLGNTRAEPTVKFDSAIEKQLNRTNELLEKINNKTVAPKFKDDVTPKTRQMESSLQRLTSKVWGVTVKLKDGVSSGLSKVNNALTSPIGMLGVGAGAMGVGGLITNSATKAMDFDAQISTIKALTGGKGGDIQSIRQRALELGKNTKFSALEAAQGMTELLKAGINVKDVLGDASQAALDLAAAGDLSLTEAAEIMSTSMNAFGMKDATKAANLLAGAANASATDVHELKYALSQIGPVAAGVGMNLDDVSTGLAVLAQNGLKSSDAGTSLKTMLNGLIPTTKPAVEAFSKLGLLEADGGSAFFDAKGKVKSIEQIADLLHNSMKDLTEEQRYTLLYDMFGSDAIRGGMILIKEGAEGIRKMRQEMTKFTVSSVATTKMDNAKGDIERMKGAFETFQIEALTPMLPAIREIAQALDNLFSNTDFLYAVQGKISDISIGITNMLSELGANQEFQNMQWGDKIVYVLDRGMEALDKWAGGEGGEQFGKVMTKLAEIGIKAFMTALLGMMKASLNAVLEGNFSGALALALGASFMGGGALISGIAKAGKGLYNFGKNKNWSSGQFWNPYAGIPNKGMQSTFGVLKKLPILGMAFDAYDIATSNDKVKTSAEVAGGWGGALAVGKIGAAIGTAIAPGIGTAIGGLVGGGFGYFGGSKIGEAVVDFLRGRSAKENIDFLNTMNTTPYNPAIYSPNMINPATTQNGTWFNGEEVFSTKSIFEPYGQAQMQSSQAQMNANTYLWNGIQDTVSNTASTIGETQMQSSQMQMEANIELWNTLKTTVGDATSYLGEQISAFSEYASQGWASLGENASANLDRLRYSLLSVGESVSNSVTVVEQGFSEICSSVSSWCSQTVSEVVNWFSQIPDRIGDFISEAVARAETGLTNLKAKAWGALPSPLQDGLNFVFNPTAGHALGGIFDREHIARFAEGNKPEAVIPLSSSLRSRGLSIWQQAGEMLGINRDLFANVTNSGFTPAMAYAASGDSSNTQNNSNSFSFNGLNINIGNGKSEKETAYEIGQMILNEIKQTFDNRG